MKKIRLTKKFVSNSMIKSHRGGKIEIGSLVGFHFPDTHPAWEIIDHADIVFLEHRAFANAFKWGWINKYGVLLKHPEA